MQPIINLSLVTALLCGASLLHAATVKIINHSFENGKNLPPVDSWKAHVPDGWTRHSGHTGLQGVSKSGETGVDGTVAVFLQTGAIRQDLAGTIAKTVAIGDQFSLTVATTNQNGPPTFDFDIQNSEGHSLIGGPVTSAPDAPDNPKYADIVVNGTVDTNSTEVFLVLSNSIGQTRIDNVRLDFVAAPEASRSALISLAGISVVLHHRK